MRMNIRNSSRKSATTSHALKIGSNSTAGTLAIAAKLRKKWRFAPDAIGMVDGPKDLSQRKGLSG
jgi:hypothetical protein